VCALPNIVWCFCNAFNDSWPILHSYYMCKVNDARVLDWCFVQHRSRCFSLRFVSCVFCLLRQSTHPLLKFDRCCFRLLLWVCLLEYDFVSCLVNNMFNKFSWPPKYTIDWLMMSHTALLKIYFTRLILWLLLTSSSLQTVIWTVNENFHVYSFFITNAIVMIVNDCCIEDV